MKAEKQIKYLNLALWVAAIIVLITANGLMAKSVAEHLSRFSLGLVVLLEMA